MRSDLIPETNAGFRYFLHAWREEPTTGLFRCNQLFGTDGKRVRLMRSRGGYLTYERREEPDSARKIVDVIETQWEPQASLMGYESLAECRRVAVLRRGGGDDEGWAAFRCDPRSFPSDIAVEPADLDPNGLRIHLVSGAEQGWRGGEPVIQGALEVRSWGDQTMAETSWLLDEVTEVEIRATAGRAQSVEEIGITPSSERCKAPQRLEEIRAEVEFPVDSVVYRNCADRPMFQIWFILEFTEELFPVPVNWRRFWMKVDL